MTERRLPVRQLVILSICRFAEPIALTSVFPYLPEMMESFGIPENDIARWAGAASAIFSICQASTGLLWGAASDKYGRKPIVLLGLFNTMWTMLLWGFSTNLPMALIARALEGLGNGNVGLLRTMVAELCPWKELQPRAFSVMPLVYTIGAVIGPTFGGALSNPLHVDPRKPRGDALLERFPYLLPNLAAAIIFAIGILVGWLFLEETLASKKHHQDLGLRTGARLTAFFRKTFRPVAANDNATEEREPLMGRQKATPETVATEGVASEIIKEGSPRIRDVLTYQTTLNLVVYALLAFYTLAYDQLLPVLMHHPTQSRDDPNVQLPLKFAGGFGIDSRRIGAIFTIFAVASVTWQFVLFPPVARYLGVLRCLRIAFSIFPFVYFVTPFVTLISDPITKQVVMTALLMVRGIGGTFAFPTSTIMITNSASSLRVLGTINGVATSISAVGRAAGPAVGGGLFTFGVKRGYIIVPFWTLSAVALLTCIPTYYLVEGKGFGDDAESKVKEAIEPRIIRDEEQPPTRQDQFSDYDAAQSESDFGEPANLLTLTSTRSSAAMLSDDDADDDEDGHGRWRQGSNGLTTARSHSQVGRRHVVKRQSSVPIGMGVGFRRYSSNLGTSGIGANGTSWGGT
ncbi:hypothetical protein HBI09_087880 [Parastagonospora nodorum]|nr:hypothetical protein HBI09_087880 [Parastagonospora nodorum]KAH5018885.1 hypothetical protein HBI77_047130 [Parastagonospora nodorum]